MGNGLSTNGLYWPIHSAVMILSLVGFLGGLRIMRLGFEQLAEGRLVRILRRFVQTPTRGVLTGVIATAMTQSSAAITAMCVGLVASQTMVFRHALGVILGANVGSTVTPQLLTLNLWVIVIPSFIIGAVGSFMSTPGLRNAGMAIFGFACIFIALQCLTKSMSPIAATAWFARVIAQSGQVTWIAVVAGCLGSALVQSSTAITVITMAMAAQNLISLQGAVAIVLGANIGTCATALLAAIGQPRAALRVAVAHLILNGLGVLLILPILGEFTHMVTWTAATTEQRIANAHTLFNLASTLIAWPLLRPFATLVERLVPDS